MPNFQQIYGFYPALIFKIQTLIVTLQQDSMKSVDHCKAGSKLKIKIWLKVVDKS